MRVEYKHVDNKGVQNLNTSPAQKITVYSPHYFKPECTLEKQENAKALAVWHMRTSLTFYQNRSWKHTDLTVGERTLQLRFQVWIYL